MDNINKFLNFENPKQLFFDVCLWIACGGFLLYLAGQLYWSILCCHWDLLFLVNAPEPIRVLTFLLLLISLFYFVKYIWKELKGDRDEIYRFRKNHWPDKWIFNGGISLVPDGLVINSSRAGCLLRDCYWRDFRMSFDMKFTKEDGNFQHQKLFGIIFRAKDMDNYFMIEIGCHESGNNKCIGVKPHVRYRGGWEELAVKEIDEFSDQQFCDLANFRKFVLEVSEGVADLYFEGENIYSWELPTHVDVNHYEGGVREGVSNGKSDTFLLQDHVKKIPFRLGYGLVGFRSHWNHLPAIIKNLDIKPI